MEYLSDLFLRQVRVYTKILNTLEFHACTSFFRKYRSERNGLYSFGTKWAMENISVQEGIAAVKKEGYNEEKFRKTGMVDK